MIHDESNSGCMTIFIVLTLVILPMLITIFIRMEGEKPTVKTELSTLVLGSGEEFQINIEDHKSGIRQLRVSILQDGLEKTVLEKFFQESGIMKKGQTNSESVRIKIEPQELGLKNGKAMIRILAVDYSWKSWGNGNRTNIEIEITIDKEGLLPQNS